MTQQAMLASLKAMHDSIKLESAKLGGVLSTHHPSWIDPNKFQLAYDAMAQAPQDELL